MNGFSHVDTLVIALYLYNDNDDNNGVDDDAAGCVDDAAGGVYDHDHDEDESGDDDGGCYDVDRDDDDHDRYLFDCDDCFCYVEVHTEIHLDFYNILKLPSCSLKMPPSFNN